MIMDSDGDFLPLFGRIDCIMQQKKRVIVAIDGNCAAGKTTLAALLKSVYSCNVFSMDDFFLQPPQRTQKRLAEPGGNVDYERFGQEVLEPLLAGESFAYRPYDCSEQKLSEKVFVNPHPLNIVEGVYSLHPLLSEAYDLKVFLEIEAEKQGLRLIQRNKEMYDRFVHEWIPMEIKYFDAFQIMAQCDLIFRI